MPVASRVVYSAMGSRSVRVIMAIAFDNQWRDFRFGLAGAALLPAYLRVPLIFLHAWDRGDGRNPVGEISRGLCTPRLQPPTDRLAILSICR